MPHPSLVVYNNESDYRSHYERVYCKGPIVTFDRIPVRFFKRDFDHAFFETVVNKDDTFSNLRAQRVDWIKEALVDPNSDRYVGWDGKNKRYDNNRRVTLVETDYVVIFAILKNGSGRFITAYVANSGRTLQMIKQGPKWP